LDEARGRCSEHSREHSQRLESLFAPVLIDVDKASERKDDVTIDGPKYRTLQEAIEARKMERGVDE
jgi:hypothetical protein